MAKQGSIAPDLWMKGATGRPVGPEALLEATEGCARPNEPLGTSRFPARMRNLFLGKKRRCIHVLDSKSPDFVAGCGAGVPRGRKGSRAPKGKPAQYTAPHKPHTRLSDPMLSMPGVRNGAS